MSWKTAIAARLAPTAPAWSVVQTVVSLLGGWRATAFLIAALWFAWQAHANGALADRIKADFDKHMSADREAERAAIQAAKDKESADREHFAQVEAQYEKDKNDAVAKERAVADGLRRGALRLRKEWRCPADDRAEAAAVAGQPDEGAGLRAALAGAVVRVGADADAHVRGLQELLKAERAKPIAR